MEEQRKYPRIPARLIGHLRKSQAGGIVITDISQAGAFISTNVMYAVGDVIEFDMHLKGEKVAIAAVVRWLSRQEPRGIGVEFMKATTKDSARLKRVVAHETPTDTKDDNA